MSTKLPKNFIEEFFNRTLLFAKYSIGSGKELDYMHRLKSVTVAITGTKEVLQTPNGQHMVFMAANLLSRFCLSIGLVLPSDIETKIKLPFAKGKNLLPCLGKFCKEINPYLKLEKDEKGKRYDVVIAIGSCKNNLGRTIFINSDGWVAYINTQENPLPWTSKNQNPIGAHAAACIGVAETFKAIFGPVKGSNPFSVIAAGSIVFSTFDYGFERGPAINPPLPHSITLDKLHMVSVGAINSATLNTLYAIPGIKGNLVLIEPQNVEISNLNRYILTTAEDAIFQRQKNDIGKKLIGTDLKIEAVFSMKYQDFRKHREALKIDLAVVGVDNNESRWEVQKDLPKVILCGGTEVSKIQISRHADITEKACLRCLYPGAMAPSEFIPTISFVSAFTGTLLAGEIIKEKAKEFRCHCLDNSLNIDVLSIPYYQIRQVQKSPNCACN